MLVRTDDEVYRVDAVWLGPPRATFPWRARYVSYGLGLAVMIVIMFVQRRLGISLDFFSVAWSLLLTIVITRFLGKRVNYDRPLGQIVALFRHEVTGPRPETATRGGQVRAGRVRVRSSLPRSKRQAVAMTKASRKAPKGKSRKQVLAARAPQATTVRTVADHVNGSRTVNGSRRVNGSQRVNGSRGGPA
ncbi:MAG: hypothetical protein J0I34_31655 [Pseudonocardia sp.]|uniref:hypothetical protein n=1 Tax=unclassified Pseudonocardia TaxID=2619320 RepID=UPI000868FEAE|nr:MULTISPECIES: hypothetical protein [unclassified Pseudonocardia]MBN9113326.1 hypothetical protein [Pseudonocardia sp.]ODV02014.1 MAG: hypothetical protein ABT15_26590 [Pseudonocardia sp. SCN 73-27]